MSNNQGTSSVISFYKVESGIGTSPTISITSPAQWQEFPTNTITISAIAEDNDGDVEEVIFYLDSDSIQTIISEPYQFSYNVQSYGPHSVYAASIDKDNKAA